ncbi:hypothetical protein MNEG_12046, partial [Monoraphidium neglectum]
QRAPPPRPPSAGAAAGHGGGGGGGGGAGLGGLGDSHRRPLPPVIVKKPGCAKND